MNRRDEPDRYDLAIDRTSYPVIDRLIRRHLLLPVPRPDDESADPVKGIRACSTYRLDAGLVHFPHDDTRFRFGDAVLTGNFHHLPAPAYAALVAAAPTFYARPGMDEILRLARLPQTDPVHVAALLEGTVLTETVPDTTPRLITLSRQFTSRWLPGRTLLHRSRNSDWYLSLAFTTEFRRASQATTRHHLGLDVGLDPMMTAVHDDGRHAVFRPTPLSIPRRDRLSPRAAGLLDRVVYASGRQDAQMVMGYLIHNAHSVTAERLRMNGMSRAYLDRARDRAIQDMHYAWISQYLNAARIPFTRVPAGYTSTECPRCRHVSPDNRSGDRFCCRSCGYSGNSHIVAASNVLHRGRR